MRSLRRLVPLALTGGLALGLACGGGDATGPSAASVTGIAGDGQTGPTRAQLAVPLSFVVLNSTGQPIQGVRVTWSVTPAGGATFNPATSTTDASGTAATIVTLGPTEGALVIRGNVPGIQPVTFQVTAVHPCDFVTPYTFGATVNGALTTVDCSLFGGYYYDFYGPVTVASQQGWTISMSAAFNTWVDVFRITGRTLASSGSGTPNSSLHIIVAPGAYVFGPNSFSVGATGAYTVSSVARPQTLVGCEEVWVTRGVTITDNITTTDCLDTATTPDSYSDYVGIIAFPNDTLRFTQRSTALDPLLTLFRVTSTGLVLETSNDDSVATTTDAFINFPVTQTAVYVVSSGTAVPGATGTYTLEVGGSVSLGAGPRGAAPLRLAPLRLPKGRGWH